MARTGWRYHDHGRRQFGPVFVNFTRDTPWSLPRITSWGIHIGRWTRNFSRGVDTVNTPGRGSIRRRYR